MFTYDDHKTDAVFHALAHATRRQMLDLIRATPGLGVGDLAANFDVTRIAIMNHLAVLEKAELVTSEKDGRTRRLYINVMPIQEIYERWTDTYSAYWAEGMSFIKRAAEAAAKKEREQND